MDSKLLETKWAEAQKVALDFFRQEGEKAMAYHAHTSFRPRIEMSLKQLDVSLFLKSEWIQILKQDYQTWVTFVDILFRRNYPNHSELYVTKEMLGHALLAFRKSDVLPETDLLVQIGYHASTHKNALKRIWGPTPVFCHKSEITATKIVYPYLNTHGMSKIMFKIGEEWWDFVVSFDHNTSPEKAWKAHELICHKINVQPAVKARVCDAQNLTTTKTTFVNCVNTTSNGEEVKIPSWAKAVELTECQKNTLRFLNQDKRLSNCYRVIRDQWVTSPYGRRAAFTMTRAQMNKLQNFCGSVVCNATGSGKTLASLLVCEAPSLIVVPDALVSHWVSEVRKHTHLTVYEDESFVDRSKRVKMTPCDVMTFHRTEHVRKFDWERLPHIMIVSHSTFKSKFSRTKYTTHAFKHLIVDEAHKAPTNVTETITKIQRENTVLVTATPYEAANKLIQLFGLDLGAFWLCDAILYKFLCIQAPHQHTFNIRETIVTCPMQADEKEFFEDVKNTLKRHQYLYGTKIRVQFIFRLLERLGAGGKIHRELFLTLLSKALSQNNQPQTLGIHEKAEKQAFMARDDNCAICLGQFSEPCQTPCGHVFCKVCIESLQQLTSHLKCPHCRAPVQKLFWANFDGQIERQHVDHHMALDNIVLNLKKANAVEGDEKEVVHLRGKLLKLEEELKKWDKSPLVVFAKESISAEFYHQVLTQYGSVLCAGLMGARKMESIGNIERFRRGEAEILFVSNKYCEGFDLFTVKEIWLLNSDISVTKMEQSVGRCQRVSQVHDEIIIKPFLYENMFDAFLWNHRKDCSFAMNKSILTFYFYDLFKDDVSTLYGKAVAVLRKNGLSTDARPLKSSGHKMVTNQVVMDFTGDFGRMSYGRNVHDRIDALYERHCH